MIILFYFFYWNRIFISMWNGETQYCLSAALIAFGLNSKAVKLYSAAFMSALTIAIEQQLHLSLAPENGSLCMRVFVLQAI